MCTNKYNFGAIIHQYYWANPEIYLTLTELETIAKELKLKILESDYYDMPLWFDAPLTSYDTIHLKIKDSWIKKLTVLEQLSFLKMFRAHHIYCLAERRN